MSGDEAGFTLGARLLMLPSPAPRALSSLVRASKAHDLLGAARMTSQQRHMKTCMSALKLRRDLAMENLLLRQQLAVYARGLERDLLAVLIEAVDGTACKEEQTDSEVPA